MNILKFNKVFLAVSAAISLASIVLLFTKGLNLSIDFTGGLVIDVTCSVELETCKQGVIRTAADMSLDAEVKRKDDGITIRAKTSDADVADALFSKLDNNEGMDVVRKDFVAPVFSGELIYKVIFAVLLGLLSVALYILIRFNAQYAISAVITLLHDVVIVLGMICILEISFDISVIAALLTIIGYSINDSVIIFDRIRAEILNNKDNKSLHGIITHAVNVTLPRTTITSVTTLVSVLAILFCGGYVIYGFAMVMLIGVTFGTYSSIFISATLLMYLRGFTQKKNA